jgi:RND family efflux transporter MFP subunit
MRYTLWQFVSFEVQGRPLLVVAAVLASFAAGCNRPAAPSPNQANQPAPVEAPTVKVVHPERKDVRRPIERPGYNIEADEKTPLYAKIAGYVGKWNVDIGATVHKDDVLAELYIPEMEVELKQKEASVGQAAAEIKQADAAVVRARAEWARAKSQYERMARLTSVVNKDEVDEYRLGFEAAQAGIAKAEADVDLAKARLKYAEADKDHIQTLLQYTKVRAPYDGVITQRNVNTWDFVQPAAANKGESLFVIERIKPVRVFVNLPEPEAVWVRDGDAALIRVQSLQAQPFKGTVTRTARSLNPQNRTLRTEIDLPNTEGKLLPGMFVNVTIVVEHKNVWALPATAIVSQGEQTFCFRVENGKAVRMPVKVALRGSELVEVLKKQIKPAKAGEEGPWEDFAGDEEVISNPAGLGDGQAVTVK